MKKLENLGLEGLETINGGGPIGAVVGGVFGLGGGLVAGAISAAATGNVEDAGHIIWSVAKKGLTGGIITGALSPL
jgi:hypothetical protein